MVCKPSEPCFKPGFRGCWVPWHSRDLSSSLKTEGQSPRVQPHQDGLADPDDASRDLAFITGCIAAVWDQVTSDDTTVAFPSR